MFKSFMDIQQTLSLVALEIIYNLQNASPVISLNCGVNDALFLEFLINDY